MDADARQAMGARIKQALEAKGLRQSVLAREVCKALYAKTPRAEFEAQVNNAKSRVNYLIKGASKNPELPFIAAVAQVLEVRIDWLYNGKGEREAVVEHDSTPPVPWGQPAWPDGIPAALKLEILRTVEAERLALEAAQERYFQGRALALVAEKWRGPA